MDKVIKENEHKHTWRINFDKQVHCDECKISLYDYIKGRVMNNG